MSKYTKSNKAYLRSIAKELEKIPRNLALNAGKKLFVMLVAKTRVDTGQAALNWEMQPYVDGPSMKSQRMLWGTAPSFLNAVYPVLPKFSVESNDLVTLLDYASGKANYIVKSAPAFISGVSVYNPITPGFPSFSPGSDEDYEDTALRQADYEIEYLAEKAIEQAEAEEIVSNRALRV